MSKDALAGITVIELGQGVSAPFCARVFADYGADVIKIEPPAGDLARRWGPFPGDQPHSEKSGLFLALNTGKRGVTLDVATAAGRAELLEMIVAADVLIENNRPRTMRESGLDYASLAAVNPDLIMISITPYGQTGPYADWHAYDLNAFHITAAGNRYCGRPDQAPLEHGTFSAEFFGGYVAATWGLAAVLGRANSGGQHLDVSCAEAIAAIFVGAQCIGGFVQDGTFDKRSGVGMALGAPATVLPCKDGYVWMVALEPGQWNGLRRAMGDPEWARLEMFQDMFVRAQNADMMYPLIELWTTEHSKWEVMERCQANGCPTTALFTVAEVANHPHLARERKYFATVKHPVLGEVRTLGAPIRMTESPGGPRLPAPLLGEHNAEVRRALAGARAAAAARPAPPTARKLPLAGIRVANFGWGWLGPVAGQTLGILGAEVYKIESYARVDINRTIPPFAGGVRDPNRSIQNHAAWGGNGSVSIDLKKPEGQELARQLVARSDAALENFGPGVMQKLNLGYDKLRAVRRDLVMVSMPAAGLFGPLKDTRTYGMSLSSITGLDSLTGYLDGRPIPMENAFADPLGGVIGALGVLLGLSYRERAGRGQHIDVSQQEAVSQFVAPAFMDYVFNGRVAGPMENRHPLGAGAPHGVFPCAGDDRWISIAVMADEEWRGLVRAMGLPTWAEATALETAAGRVRHIDEVHAKLAEWTGGFEVMRLVELLQANGVAAAPVYDVADLYNSPHFRARGTFVEVQHPLGFKETVYGSYVKVTGPAPRFTPGPVIGQDNEYVFKELLGISDERYRKLVEDKVIY